jgi:N-acetylmuramoyl-L-alanine amidase
MPGFSKAREATIASPRPASFSRKRGRAGAQAGRLALAAVFFLVLLAGPAAQTARAATFSDIPGSGPTRNAIDYLVGAGVLAGFPDGTFKPERQLTRAQATKILVLQHGVPISKGAGAAGSKNFKDVDALYAPYVDAAVAKGWITGFGNGTFRPYDPLQRQHLAVIMVRSQGWEAEAKALSPEEIAEALEGVTDSARIAPGLLPYVALAVSRGLFQGDADGLFNPTAGITRAQFALVVYRAELRGLTVVQGIRFEQNDGGTRVWIDLSAKPGGAVAHLSGSSVITVDVPGAVAEGPGVDVSVGTAEVDSSAARQLTYRPQAVRITLTLNRFSRYQLTTFAPSDGFGDRIAVDVFTRSDGPPGPGPPLIALDAGHGGKDPGAIGVTGVLEKDVNLAITLAVDKLLRGVGLRTVLTRDSDTYPTLTQRSDLANQAHASLFLSIHNNSAGPDSQGTETFYWGTPDKFSPEGKKLAESIQRNLVAAIGSKDRGARTHWLDLAVLAHTTMTAALTEVGFLSNAAEEAKLADPVYQDTAARGIARGILEYLGWDKELIKLTG